MNKRAAAFAGVVVLFVGAFALAQTTDLPSAPEGVQPQQGEPGKTDPNKMFDMLSRGRGYFLTEDLRQLREPLTQWLQKRGINDGKVTRELFATFQDEVRANPAQFTTLGGPGKQGPGEPKQKGPDGFGEAGKKKGGPTFRMEGPPMPTWEYKTLSMGRADEESLNKLGAEGWELVAVNSSSANKSTAVYVFKRPGGRRFVGGKKEGDAPKPGEPEPKKSIGGAGFGSGSFGGSGIGTFGPGGPGAFGPPKGDPKKTTTTGTFGGGFGTTTPGFSGPPMRKEGPPKRDFQVLFLQYGNAPDLAKVVKILLPPDMVITADPQSNAIILAGPGREATEVTELIRMLDRPREKRQADQPPTPKRAGSFTKEEWEKKMEEFKAKKKK